MIKQNFSQAAKTYAKHAFVQNEIGQRLIERLEYIQFDPKVICDLGAGAGSFSPLLAKKYPEALLLGIDFSFEMLQQARVNVTHSENTLLICNDAQTLALKQDSIDLIFSNLMLQWCPNVREVLHQVFNATSPGGLFLFSTLGPDTLKEFRASWEAVDLAPHTNDFIDMHDIGDALLQIGFQDPVIESEYLTIEYPSVSKLMQDLKGIGAQNSHPNRARGLTGKEQFNAFIETYESFRSPNGLLPVTYEVIYGLAWIPSTKPEPTINALNLRHR